MGSIPPPYTTNEQTYQSTAIWLRIRPWSVDSLDVGQTSDKARYNCLSKIWLWAGNSPRQIIIHVRYIIYMTVVFPCSAGGSLLETPALRSETIPDEFNHELSSTITGNVKEI